MKVWFSLKQDFQVADFVGQGYITNAKAMVISFEIIIRNKLKFFFFLLQELFKKHKIPLATNEIEELCKLFDVDQSSAKFDFITFMKSVSTGKSTLAINVKS
jgi:hypothetical protein